MPPRHTPEAVEVEITAVHPDGEGEGRLGRTHVAVPFTIPGERVRVHLGRTRDTDVDARLLDVRVSSPDRTAPRCRHFGERSSPPCGGCAWQHIAYPRQLELKRDIVRDAVQRALHAAPAVRPTLGIDQELPWAFRQKVHFAFAPAYRRRGYAMGHYARGSRDLLAISECPVHATPGNAVAFRIAAAAATAGPDLRLRGVLARVSRSTGRVMVTLISEGPPSRSLRALTKRVVLSDPSVASVSVSAHSGRGSLILGEETRVVAGDARLAETIDDTTYLMSAEAFFQTNGAATPLLVREVLTHVPADLPVLDLYCGGGLFSLPIARRGQRVIGIEANRTAIADAVASRHANRIPGARCQFIAAPVETALRRIEPSAARTVVMDPPRAGASTEVLNHVMRHLRPARIVYVSCDPASLARDLQHFEDGGYRTSLLQPIDMFPHTADVETVAVLTPAG